MTATIGLGLVALFYTGLVVLHLVEAAKTLRPPAELVAQVEAQLAGAIAKGGRARIAPRWYRRLSREMIKEIAVAGGYRYVGDDVIQGGRFTPDIPLLVFVAADDHADGGKR